MDKMKPDQPNTPEPTDRAEESELATPPCSEHDGDCSIYGSEICDCGALRRQARKNGGDDEAWLNHEAAIQRSIDYDEAVTNAYVHGTLGIKSSPNVEDWRPSPWWS